MKELREMATQAEIDAAAKALSEGGWDDPRTAAETALDAAGIDRLRTENAELREVLKYARKQLEDYEEVVTGEDYNDTRINAALAKMDKERE